MATFTIASFASGGSDMFGGLSFTPNVPGPDGSGSPGTATSVDLNEVTIGYPSSVTSVRPLTCYVYSVIITDPDDVGDIENLLGTSDSITDGSEFGTGSYSRSWAFNIGNLSPSKTYYVYFDATPPTNTETPQSYSGGAAYADDLTLIDDASAQFKIVMST